MKKLITLFAFSIFTLSLFAQTGFVNRYGSDFRDISYKVIQTNDGNLLVAGATFGFGSQANGFVMKTDPAGTILWLKDYPGISADIIYDVVELSDNSLVMCGVTNSYGSGSSDAFLMKTDASGNVIWARSYGDILGERFSDLALDGTGGYYVTGYSDNLDEFTLRSTILCRISETGNVLWTKRTDDYNLDPRVILLADGTALLSDMAGSHFSLWKYTETGSLVWGNTYAPTPGGSGLSKLEIMENQAGQIVVATSQASANTVAENYDFFVITLSNTGNLVWDKSYGGTYVDEAFAALIAHDGKIIVAGATNSVGNGVKDNFIAKIQTDGTFEWAKVYGTAWQESPTAIYETADFGFAFTGSTYSSGELADSMKILLVKTDPLGNAPCNDFDFTPTVKNQTLNITTAPVPYDFTIVQSSNINWTPGNRHFYTANICPPLHVSSLAFLHTEIYPNPFSHSTTLHTTDPFKDASVSIYNSLGQMVRQIDHLNGTEITIQRDDLTSGIYFMHLSQNGQSSVPEKLVVVD